MMCGRWEMMKTMHARTHAGVGENVSFKEKTPNCTAFINNNPGTMTYCIVFTAAAAVFGLDRSES